MWHFVLYQERDTTIKVVPVALVPHSSNAISSLPMHHWAISGFKSNYPSFHLSTRVARFFFVQFTKVVKNIPNNHKIYQMAKNYTK
jgi:hypothetical protein